VFKLGWFIDGYSPKTWRGPWAGRMKTEWAGSSFWEDACRGLERGGFDGVFIEDTSMIDDTYRGSMETALRFALEAPKNDPMPLLPLLARATKHLGVISTVSTIQYHPFLAARLGVTLDHLTEGRVGFNVVTSVSHRVAQNFGLEKMIDHDLRYEMACEWMDACTALWNSWEDDALILDEDGPTYADWTKVHTVDFQGKWFRTRGPLNNPPGPQRRPVIAQAGQSAGGRNLAAQHADLMLSIAKTPEQMKALREDMNRRLLAYGRDPKDFHILFLASIFLGWNQRDAEERNAAFEGGKTSSEWVETQLWVLSYLSGGEIDYSKFGLDDPFPEELGNGQVSTFQHILANNPGATMREVLESRDQLQGLTFVGDADSVSEQMNDAISETDGPDGYLIMSTEDMITRKGIAEITDGLCATLRKKGYIRDVYAHNTFRENLNDNQ
jgi:FMN-dependent oxidoreductase (nitrilotriacetate monooxygenase family)